MTCFYSFYQGRFLFVIVAYYMLVLHRTANPVAQPPILISAS